MIDAGLDPVTVAGVLGHDDPSITLKVYAAGFNRQSKDEAVRAALSGVSHPRKSLQQRYVETASSRGLFS